MAAKSDRPVGDQANENYSIPSVRIEGYVDSSRKDRVRIYQSPERTTFIDLPANAVVHDMEDKDTDRKFVIVKQQQSTGGIETCVTTRGAISYDCGTNEDGSTMFCRDEFSTTKCTTGRVYIPNSDSYDWVILPD